MRTETINIYTYPELSESAQRAAHESYVAAGDTWFWQDEWWQSAQEFCKIAPISLDSADYDRAEFDATYTGPELSGVRAWKWLKNNGWFDLAARNAAGECTLTGYCGDCPLFDPIAKLADRPQGVPDLEELFRDCLYAWIFEARDDLEYSQSEESFAEMCESNEWEFTESGEMI